MEEGAQLGKGLVIANLISLAILIIFSLFSNLITGLLMFAVSLPVSAYISSKTVKKIED